MNDVIKQQSLSWDSLPRPFSVLAPMDGVTDVAFRRLVCACGRPDVVFTEFVHLDGLRPGLDDGALKRLQRHPDESSVVVQVWGGRPEQLVEAVPRLMDMGFSGVDLNMSCPTPNVLASGCCAALIQKPELACEFLQAALEAAQGRVPISVKTRLGFGTDVIEDWAGRLLRLNPAALTVHGRLASQMYAGDADWEAIGRVVRLRDRVGSDTVIIGNGDVQSHDEMVARHERYGVDGVMIGRAARRNPFVFNPTFKAMKLRSATQRCKLLTEHVRLCREHYGDKEGTMVIKRFIKSYLVHFKGSPELRAQLIKTETLTEIEELLRDYQS